VAAGDFFHLEAEALSRDALLEFDREEAIVATGDDVDGDLRPLREGADVLEDALGLGALVRAGFAEEIFGHVVEEVRLHVEVGGVAACFRGFRSRFVRARVFAPRADALAGIRDHRVQ